MNPIPMVLADLRSMRASAFLIVALLAVAVAFAVAVSLQERALRQASARAADDFPLLVAAPGSETQLVLTSIFLQPHALPLLDGAVYARLQQDERVAAVSPVALGDVVHGYPLVGVTRDLATRWGRLVPSEGRLFAGPGEAVVGADVKISLGERLVPSHMAAGETLAPGEEDEDEAEHRHGQAQTRVVGRLPRTGSAWDKAVLVPIEAVWVTHGLDPASHPAVPALVVRPKSVAGAYALRSAYRQGGSMALFPAEVLVSLYQTMGDVRTLLMVASLLNNGVVFLALLMLLSVMVGLRRRRYAALRAIGASRLYIGVVVWLGAALLTCAGAVAGLGLGWLGARLVSRVIAGRTGLALAPALDRTEIGLVALLAVAGATCALAIALVSQKVAPADALRG